MSLRVLLIIIVFFTSEAGAQGFPTGDQLQAASRPSPPVSQSVEIAELIIRLVAVSNSDIFGQIESISTSSPLVGIGFQVSDVVRIAVRHYDRQEDVFVEASPTTLVGARRAILQHNQNHALVRIVALASSNASLVGVDATTNGRRITGYVIKFDDGSELTAPVTTETAAIFSVEKNCVIRQTGTSHPGSQLCQKDFEDREAQRAEFLASGQQNQFQSAFYLGCLNILEGASRPPRGNATIYCRCVMRSAFPLLDRASSLHFAKYHRQLIMFTNSGFVVGGYDPGPPLSASRMGQLRPRMLQVGDACNLEGAR